MDEETKCFHEQVPHEVYEGLFDYDEPISDTSNPEDPYFYEKSTGVEDLSSYLGRIILKNLIQKEGFDEKSQSTIFDSDFEARAWIKENVKTEDDLFERLLKAEQQREEQMRRSQERLAEERRRREEEAHKEQERQEAERLRRAQESQDRRVFSPSHEARLTEMAALFPELSDRDLRNLFATVIDSRASGTPDAKVFRTLAKKYHPDTAPEEQRDTYGRVMGVLGNLYDSKTKCFRLA